MTCNMTKDEYFAEIYTKYKDKIYQFIYARIHDPQIAEDLTNDVFVSVYKNLHTYNADRSFITTWLYAIASNRLKNYYKSKSRMEYSVDCMEETGRKKPSDGYDPMEQEEWRIVMECLMQKLPERSRKVVWFRYYQNMSSREIGRQLDISPGNVRIILKRALEILKKMLSHELTL